MPDHKEMGREPTERERETVFAPHHDPEQQPDGDEGAKKPKLDHEQTTEKSDENNEGETAGNRGQWD